MRLILLRHAKTEGVHPGGDRARELNEKGRNAAAVLGEELAAFDIDHALVSTATRTRQTFELTGLDVDVEYLDEIYEQDLDEIARCIAEVPDGVQTLLIVGHSPSMPSLAMDLAQDAGNGDEAHELARSFPTSAYAVFDVEGSWTQLHERGGFDAVELMRIRRP